MPTPRVQIVKPTPRVQDAIPTPRVQATQLTIVKATINKPHQSEATKPTQKEPTLTHSKLRNKINNAQNLRSRIMQSTQMQLHHQEQRERIQLICDKETGEYLNYRQLMLMQHPKHQKIWNTSSANKFRSRRLAQEVGGRVIPTNSSIFFIRQSQ